MIARGFQGGRRSGTASRVSKRWNSKGPEMGKRGLRGGE